MTAAEHWPTCQSCDGIGTVRDNYLHVTRGQMTIENVCRKCNGFGRIAPPEPCPTCGGSGFSMTPDNVGAAFVAALERRGVAVDHLRCPDCNGDGSRCSDSAPGQDVAS